MELETRICQNCKNQFAIERDDFSFYERAGIPPPTWCSDCRRMRRMAWRNDYNFYNRECGLCRRNIISIYSPEKPVPIYCNKCWWSDGWDPKTYGKEINFSKPFFPQFRELLDRVPALAILNDNNIASDNCEYTNYFALGKNCYLTMNSWKVENAYYSYYMVGAKDVVDLMTTFEGCRNIYDSIFVGKSNSCRNVYDVHDSINCSFCYDCRDCSSCFMSVGLRHKKYCIKNKQHAKEDYEKIVQGYALNTWSGSEKTRKEFREFILKFPRRGSMFTNCVNSTGNYLVNSKNALNCFNAIRVEHSRFFENGDTIKDSYDCHSGGEQELCCEGINPDNSYGTHFTSYCHKDRDVLYSDSCDSSEELFGCVGLKKARHCIFNKQYDEEEYSELKNKLIAHMKQTGEWGEFFLVGLSTFGYNETLAQQDYPLSKAIAIDKGYKWQEKLQFTSGKESLSWDRVPDSIDEVPDSIVGQVLACVECKRNFKIVEGEFLFYKSNRIPIPRKCFYCRLREKLTMRNPVKLWPRTCQCAGAHSENGSYENTMSHFHSSAHCSNKFETSYAPDRPEIVYCEQCYQAEVA